MPYYPNQTKNYLRQVCEKIQKAIYVPVAELAATAWITSEPVSFEERCTGQEKKIVLEEKWGNLWDCAWFNFTGEVPRDVVDKKVVLLIDVSGEGCIFDEQGCPVRGLTNGSSVFDRSLGEPGKRVVQFLDKSEGGEKVDLWMDAGCNDLFGTLQYNGILKEAHIATCNQEMRQLYYDFAVLYELMENLSEEEARYHSILYTLNDAAKVMRNYTIEEAKKARTILEPELAKNGGDPSLTISAIGHAHIDLAWLWPIRETIRKGARTFSTVLELMDRYPDYVFGASQPQLYQWMKDRYPLLYDKIKERIAEGRWEAQGAMWVEADTNISGGEALVRQCLYGKRFFRNEFDKDMKVLWLPDVFGYTGSLPQILKKSGVDYFMTIKLSWSEHNRFPHHTFHWQGIDGTKILAHMPPEGTYNSAASPKSIKKAEKDFLDKGISDQCLMLFGIGDGGGGPGAEHLERLDREKNLAGLAEVIQEPSLEFFKKIEKNAERYQSWSGELYLEKHQGTLTTQAKNKRFNRKLEIALRELEYASMLAFYYTNSSYPQAEIEEIWKEVLLYQFHDILPGSSIKRVYDESVERYEQMLARTKELTQQAYTALADNINVAGLNSPYIIYNSLPWERKEWLQIEEQWIQATVPSMGYATIDLNDDSNTQNGTLIAAENLLENDYLSIGFAEDGAIQWIFDKENNRQVIADGVVANRLAIYEDDGDAWDFALNYAEKPVDSFKLQITEAFVNGLEAIVKHVYTFGQSKLIQQVVLREGSRRIDFKTQVDWQESQKMLRTSFPVDVYTNEATCDIQFGTIKRPTHRNTSWDMAKYEICAHKWVDLSQRDYGVALMNDCKYGYKVFENTIDLNLLRSPGYPGVQADRGEHEFTYSLYPHAGDHVSGDVSKVAYELNVPMNFTSAKLCDSILPIKQSFVEVEANNVMIESVKKAEDDDSLIIRLYENSGAGVNTKIQFNLDVNSVELVNLMEEKIEEFVVEDNNVNLTFKPFEIHTLKIKL